MKKLTQSIVLTKKGEISKNILNALNHCNFNSESNRIYTGYYLGSGKHTTAQSSMNTIISILQAEGYKFKKGNDAPKGGIKGEYLQVSKIAFNFVFDIRKNGNK